MLLYESAIPIPFPALHGLKWLYCSRGPAVVSPDSAALPALIEYAHGLARQIHAVLLRIEPDIADDNSALACWRAAYRQLGFHSNPNAVHPPRTWVLDIGPELPALFASFKTTWRQNIRVAERKGITIREAKTAADLQAYYEVYQETSQRSHFFIHSLDYHKAILQAFGSQAILYLAEHEGQVLATRLLIWQGKWCWDMFGASSNQKSNLKATYLLQYRCLQWAKEQGCDYFDFRAIPLFLNQARRCGVSMSLSAASVVSHVCICPPRTISTGQLSPGPGRPWLSFVAGCGSIYSARLSMNEWRGVHKNN